MSAAPEMHGNNGSNGNNGAHSNNGSNGAHVLDRPAEGPAAFATEAGQSDSAARTTAPAGSQVAPLLDAAAQIRGLIQRLPEAAAAHPSSRLPTREWLVRAVFALLTVTVLGVVTFSALGLISPPEAFVVLSPVTTLAAVIIGVYLGQPERSA